MRKLFQGGKTLQRNRHIFILFYKKYIGNDFTIKIYQKSFYDKDVLAFISLNKSRGAPRGVMVKAMDCGIVVCEFELQSRYYVHFRTNTLGKSMNPLKQHYCCSSRRVALALNNPRMPLNKETKPNTHTHPHTHTSTHTYTTHTFAFHMYFL